MNRLGPLCIKDVNKSVEADTWYVVKLILRLLAALCILSQPLRDPGTADLCRIFVLLCTSINIAVSLIFSLLVSVCSVTWLLRKTVYNKQTTMPVTTKQTTNQQ